MIITRSIQQEQHKGDLTRFLGGSLLGRTPVSRQAGTNRHSATGPQSLQHLRGKEKGEREFEEENIKI